jgi:hypothetical protein
MYGTPMTTLSKILARLTMDEVVRVVRRSPVDPEVEPLEEPLCVEGPVTLMTLPFGHRLRLLQDRWEIREWTYQPTLVPVMLAGIPGTIVGSLFAYFGLFDRGVNRIEYLLIATCFLALGLLCLAMGLVWLGRYRHLRFDQKQSLFRLSCGNLLTRAHMEMTVPSCEAVLAIHEVTTFPTRAMMKDRKFAWRGWGLALHLDEDVFLLACQRKREQLLDFVAQAPRPLKEMAVLDGPRIEGLGYR